ncbi:MAG: helix-turn-helix transcriptional regulator [Saprospiraceae bacterium]
MIEIASPLPKKARYRIAEFVGNIPVSRLKFEKLALSAQLGVSIAQLNRIIRGDSDPSGTQLRVIADFFDVAVDELYADQDLSDTAMP